MKSIIASAKTVFTLALICFCSFFLTGCRPTIIKFEALEITIIEGDSTTLQWEVEFANGSSGHVVEISPDEGVVDDDEGSVVVSPDETTVYTLEATNMYSGMPVTTIQDVTVEVVEGESWHFNEGDLEWTAGMSNYLKDDFEGFVPPTHTDTLPSGLQGSAFKLVVDNPEDTDNDDGVFLFLTFKLSSTGDIDIEIDKDTDYEVGFSVKYAVNTHLSCEEFPVPDLYLKVAALSDEPEVNTLNDMKVLTVNKSELSLGDPNQSGTGDHAAVMLKKMLSNDAECQENNDHQLGSGANISNPISVTSNSEGDIWLLVGVHASSPDEDAEKVIAYIQSVSVVVNTEN